MAKKMKKGHGQGRGFSPLQSNSMAGDIARQPKATSVGVNPRVLKAQSKVRELVGQGYRLNPNANTSATYRQAVADVGSPAGRLKKLTKVR